MANSGANGETLDASARVCLLYGQRYQDDADTLKRWLGHEGIALELCPVFPGKQPQRIELVRRADVVIVLLSDDEREWRAARAATRLVVPVVMAWRSPEVPGYIQEHYSPIALPENLTHLLEALKQDAVEEEPPDPGALEELGEAVALADGFQFIPLQCDALDNRRLRLVIEAVNRHVRELSGRPPLSFVLDPSRTVRGLDSITGTAREELWDVVALQPLLSLPKLDEGSYLAVVSGLTYSPYDWQDLIVWREYLSRVNERRNALMRSFCGTLVFAGPQSFHRLLFEAAPDLASIRSGMIRLHSSVVPTPKRATGMDPRMWYPAEVVAHVAYLESGSEASRREAPDAWLSSSVEVADTFSDSQRFVSKGSGPHVVSPVYELKELLLRLFTQRELFDLAEHLGPIYSSQLGRSRGREAVDALVSTLVQLKGLDAFLFEFLARERPEARDEIAATAREFGVALGIHRPTTADLDSLHAMLLRLSRDDLRRVVGFLWGDVNWLVRKRPLSARELIKRAEDLGTDGLLQLQEAVNLVMQQPA